MKISPKLYIISAILIALIIMIIILFSGKKKTDQSGAQPTSPPIPTLFKAGEKTGQPGGVEVKPSPLVPSAIIPTYTGGQIMNNLTPEEMRATDQKRELRNKCPLQLEGFSIDFDYEQDMFTVNFSESNIANREVFTQWLTQTYPDIPIDRFNIK